jgi:DNA topoisomerase VI subunit A
MINEQWLLLLASCCNAVDPHRYAVPSLAWLGVTSDMLTEVPGSACQGLTARDRAQVTNLKARLAEGCPGWVSELEEMEAMSLKADIEALYTVVGHAGLRALLVQRVLQRQYLM